MTSEDNSLTRLVKVAESFRDADDTEPATHLLALGYIALAKEYRRERRKNKVAEEALNRIRSTHNTWNMQHLAAMLVSEKYYRFVTSALKEMQAIGEGKE